jgi:hypothetical protein
VFIDASRGFDEYVFLCIIAVGDRDDQCFVKLPQCKYFIIAALSQSEKRRRAI